MVKHLLSFFGGLIVGFLINSSYILSIEKTAVLSNYDDGSYKTSSHPSSKGWKSIDVFFGDEKHIVDVTKLYTPYFETNQWFSQYRQDEIVSRLLKGKKNGYFIDLASNDAVRISNTYALERFYGWNGICLEPNSMYWAGLAYRKCHVAAAVVGNQTMDEVKFTFPKEKAATLGGIVGRNFDNSLENSDNIQRRYTVTLREIFQRFSVPHIVDYMSLDVEGAEDLVMTSFPFEDYRFNILTVERYSKTLSKILKTNGYSLLKTIKSEGETLWIHESIKDSVDMAAMKIDTETYKYRERSGQKRITPEEASKEWKTRFKELKEYRTINGNCNVMAKYNKDLARFVRSQRNQYMRKQEGNLTKMTKDEIEMLESTMDLCGESV